MPKGFKIISSGGTNLHSFSFWTNYCKTWQLLENVKEDKRSPSWIRIWQNSCCIISIIICLVSSSPIIIIIMLFTPTFWRTASARVNTATMNNKNYYGEDHQSPSTPSLSKIICCKAIINISQVWMLLYVLSQWIKTWPNQKASRQLKRSSTVNYKILYGILWKSLNLEYFHSEKTPLNQIFYGLNCCNSHIN